MPRSLSFNLDPVVTGLLATGIAIEHFVNRLTGLIEIDARTGDVKIDTVGLVETAERSLEQSTFPLVVSALMDVGTGGVAVFNSHDGARERSEPHEAIGARLASHAKVDERLSVAIPWTFISDLVFSLQGTPQELRNALGFDRATNRDEAAELLRRAFPNVPEWILKGKAGERLVRNPIAMPGGGFGGVPPKPPDEKPAKPPGQQGSTGGWQGFIAPAVDDAVEAARCLLNGSWGPLGGNFWGWAIGWQVCINQDCARKLQKLLTGLGGGTALLDSLKTLLGAQSVAAGLKALTLTAGLLIAIYGFLLGINIGLVNWAKGVCIQGNWPVIGGPGAFVWAVAGS